MDKKPIHIYIFLITFLVALVSGGGRPALAAGDTVPQTARFIDVTKQDPNCIFIKYISQRQIINGFPDNSYHPQEVINRAQAAVIICKAAGLSTMSEGNTGFKDVPVGHWANKYINTAVKAGYLTGFGDGTYRPEAALTRAQGISLVMRLCTRQEQAPLPQLNDMNQKHWAAPVMGTAISLAMINMSADGKNIYPEADMTRGNMARALAILLTEDPGLNQTALEGKLSDVTGQVTLTRSGQSQAVKTDCTVLEGDKIETGRDSSFRISYPDGSSNLIEANSTIVIKESRGRRYIKKDGTEGIAVDYLNLSMDQGTLYGTLATKHRYQEQSETSTEKQTENNTQSRRTEQRLAAGDGFHYLAAAADSNPAVPWYKSAESKKVKVKVDMPWGIAAIRGTFVKITVNPDKTCRVSCLTGSADLTGQTGTSITLTGNDTANVKQEQSSANKEGTLDPEDKEGFSETKVQVFFMDASVEQEVNQSADIISEQITQGEESTVQAVIQALEDAGITLTDEAVEELEARVAEALNQVDETVAQELQDQVNEAENPSPTTEDSVSTGSGDHNDSTSKNSTINLTAASFDKNSPLDITVAMTLNGNTLSSVSNGTTPLLINTDYIVSGATVIILKEYLAIQSLGTTTLTFNFSAGSDQSLAIVISNSLTSAPQLQMGINYYVPVPGSSAGTIKIDTPSLPAGADKWRIAQQAAFFAPNSDEIVSGADDYTSGSDYSVNIGQHVLLLATDASDQTKAYADIMAGTAMIKGSGYGTIVCTKNNGYALKANGTVWAWGDNYFGQMGDGSTTSSTVPVQITGLTDVTAISAAQESGYALKSDGTVWAWGLNGQGQLGDGSTTNRLVPVQVTGLTDATTISGGWSSGYALKADGTVWAWGDNGKGQLGDGSTTNSAVPVQVSSLTSIIAIANVGHSSYALKADGTVWAWGDNVYGQLGDGSTTNSLVPVQVSSLTGVTAIAGGCYSGYALKADGTVWAWGYNSSGTVGDGSNQNRTIPVQVSSLTGVTAIAGGWYSGYALKSDGTVWAWGANVYGQLGNNSTTKSLVPVQVSGLTGIKAIGSAGYSGFALKSDGAIWSWGYNFYGQLGNDSTTDSPVPVQVQFGPVLANTSSDGTKVILTFDSDMMDSPPAAPDGFIVRADGIGDAVTGLARGTIDAKTLELTLDRAISSSQTVTVSYTPGSITEADGRVLPPFGSRAVNNNSTIAPLLGLGVNYYVPVPGSSAGTIKIDALSLPAGADKWRIAQQAAAFAPNSDEIVSGADDYTSGSDYSVNIGQHVLLLATDASDQTKAYVDIIAGTAMINGSGYGTIACAEYSCYRVNPDGTVWSWGCNANGELGDNTTLSRKLPVQVSSLTGITAVGGGNCSGHAIGAGGTVWAWGSNPYGDLGDGTTDTRLVPVQLSGLTGFTAVVGGAHSGYALNADGTVWSWGCNSNGELGDNTTTDRLVPEQVPSLTGITAIASSANTGFALKSDGTVWAAGYKDLLGYYPAADSHVFIQVPGLTGVTAISSGQEACYALRSDGTVWAWGTNGYYNLGDGQAGSNLAPKQIAGLTNVIAVAGGWNTGYAVKADGTVWVWGFNEYGQLGDNSTTTRPTPVQVPGLTDVVTIIGGKSNGYALKADGTIWAWGLNNFGQLGINSTTDSHVPVQVQL